ncbi:MAG: nickel pincer cofactor biosynthesis protein LarC [Candidatus Electronema sp. V4]|uniref:nickel pincer cofactor biosynthesis protein LarC n=1 Tax=Candidatus Electronema sp. V4 TaxID=3454756 RepID=UPI00405574BF
MMEKICYLDCFSGISGNMLLGALLDAGLPEELLRAELAKLRLPGWRLKGKQVAQSGLRATLVQVQAVKCKEHRHLADIQALLEQSGLHPAVRERAVAVFQRLAEAEARVHGSSVDEVHFHEVGAADAIIDIVGAVAGLHHLGISEVICSPLPLASGWVRCAHGELPLPAPAVCELLKNVPVRGELLAQELVTPTGAALAVTLSSSFGPLPPMILSRSGYGAGTRRRRDGRPNLLRLLIGQAQPVDEAQQVEVIETCLDDWNSEFWPHVSAKMMAAGALDVSLSPVQMKKGRPGFLLRLIADPAHAARLKELVFKETSAIGLRFHSERRMTLPRTAVELATPWGAVRAKQVELPDGGCRLKPEYEDCARLANEQGVPLQQVHAAAQAAAALFNSR